MGIDEWINEWKKEKMTERETVPLPFFIFNCKLVPQLFDSSVTYSLSACRNDRGSTQGSRRIPYLGGVTVTQTNGERFHAKLTMSAIIINAISISFGLFIVFCFGAETELFELSSIWTITLIWSIRRHMHDSYELLHISSHYLNNSRHYHMLSRYHSYDQRRPLLTSVPK